ncbi:hypothetical protein BVI434_1230043 [Burkholderia vietnamiensis]|nr:hypothetical protein BVI434_1230043 [Burkholderia vietnamiensis]
MLAFSLFTFRSQLFKFAPSRAGIPFHYSMDKRVPARFD